MSKIDDIKAALHQNQYFYHDSGTNYVRILDTPNVWGLGFDSSIMPSAIARQQEFERAIVETIQLAKYRCDVASLNCPDPDWSRVILYAMDTVLTEQVAGSPSIQFRFLFGQTPMNPTGEPWNLMDFKAAIVRLFRSRATTWSVQPSIWVGRFYRFKAGILDSLANKFLPAIMQSDEDTKMTWNHSKIIAVDGAQAIVGGHNLNMDLFRSYPPVHDASVVVHGSAAHGAQLFLNEMWIRGSDLFVKDQLNTTNLTWTDNTPLQPPDPLVTLAGQTHMAQRVLTLQTMHATGVQPGVDAPIVPDPIGPPPEDIEEHDLQTIDDLALDVFPPRVRYHAYDKLDQYRMASRILSVGKYWTGTDLATAFKRGSEVMKQHLILNAQRTIRMSQMDLVSAWKKNWSDHTVCQWLITALVQNPYLRVQVVVSPLDAGAGAEGDQYSFGSGAIRTFRIMEYYMHHQVNDQLIPDPYGLRAHALERLSIAPFCYTNVPVGLTEGGTYKWPGLTPDGRTATLKQPPIAPPLNGIVGSSLSALVNASGYIHAKVDSAPGNHAKITIVDDEAYAVGSDNLYPGNLSEFNYLVEGQAAVARMLEAYWNKLWMYSEPHRIRPLAPGGNGAVSTIHTSTTLSVVDPDGSTSEANSAEIRVTLVNANGNPVPNVRVAFERSSGSATLTTPSGFTNANGRFSSKLSDGTQGVSVFRAKFDDTGSGTPNKYVVYGSPATVTFSAPPPPPPDPFGTGG